VTVRRLPPRTTLRDYTTYLRRTRGSRIHDDAVDVGNVNEHEDMGEENSGDDASDQAIMSQEHLLWLEVDDSCALCGCRERRALTIHHIDGNDNNNSYDNRIILCYSCHQRHHNSDGDVSRKDIEDRKRRLIMKTLTQFGVNALKIADRTGHLVGAPFLLVHLVELGYLRLEAEHDVFSAEEKKDVEVTNQYSISAEGKRVLNTWLR